MNRKGRDLVYCNKCYAFTVGTCRRCRWESRVYVALSGGACAIITAILLWS